MRNKKSKLLPFILSAVMMLFMVFAVFYIAEESVHECEGEECSVCECIHICEGILYRTRGAEFILISAAAAYVFVCLIKKNTGSGLSYDTLVSEKIRMDS